MTEPVTGPPFGRAGAAGGRRRPRKADLPRDPLGRLRPAGQPDALAYLEELRRDPPTPAEAWRRAVALQGEQRCYEAYEHVVVVWRHPQVVSSDRPLWRALAQVAAACCHVQRGNPTGARKVLDRAAGGLHAYASCHAGVDVATTLQGVVRLRADLDTGREPASLPPLVPLDDL